MSLPEEKAGARRAAFAARKAAFAARPRGGIERLAEGLAPYQGQGLAGYMPMRTEIDPLWAMGAHEGPVCVPVITGAGLPLVFRRWTPTARMVPGEFGALIPEAGDLLVPRVLGYGGGFYDRTLEGLRAAGRVTAIGFAFAAQEVGRVPTEPIDQPLDLIVTEHGCLVP